MSSSELKPIILYDIPCITPGLPWSPNTMKARYCLGYKQLPFTTTWVEIPDIPKLLQSKGVTHPPYTLPTIEDPNTGALVVDSVAIATYLDETYAETPKVWTPAALARLEEIERVLSFAPGGAPASVASHHTGASDGTVLHADKTGAAWDIAPRLVFILLTVERLNPTSKVHYHQIRGARHGEKWSALHDACSASPEDRAERVRQGIEAIKGAWHEVTKLYVHRSDAEEGTSGGPFVFGEEPCFLDFVVAGRVKFALNALDPSDAETLKNLEGGRLFRLVEDLERYYKY